MGVHLQCEPCVVVAEVTTHDIGATCSHHFDSYSISVAGSIVRDLILDFVGRLLVAESVWLVSRFARSKRGANTRRVASGVLLSREGHSSPSGVHGLKGVGGGRKRNSFGGGQTSQVPG